MDRRTERNTERARLGTLFAFGTGSVAVGTKNIIFGSWLMLYYNQVLGMKPYLAGLALAIALVFDAVTDPLVGAWSDRVRTRWGRRHPFIYVSLLPFATSVYWILQPVPDPTQSELFFRLLFFSVAVRVSMTFYDVPRNALGPELTKDYDQRTLMMGISTAFGWLGGAGIAAVALGLLFPESPEYSRSRALLNPEGYAHLAVISALVIFVSGLISTIGLHSQIPYLHVPDKTERIEVRKILNEILETLSNRSWLVVFLSGLVFALFIGLQSGTDHYYNIYFWQWVPQEISSFPIAQAFVAIICGFSASVVSKGREKKKLAVRLFSASVVLGPLPVGLRLMDSMVSFSTFPANGTDFLWWTMLLHSCTMIVLATTGFILIGSMVADIVEESQAETGRRSEGLLNAGPALAQKTMSAGGVLITGIILSTFGFDVPNPSIESMQEPMIKLATAHLILGMTLPVISTYLISKYTITRSDHEKRVRQLGYASDDQP
ncbi:MAG: MFS transporter [Myxococcota bacterium]|nr:MFS transporter [Myxococcota bacterium]